MRTCRFSPPMAGSFKLSQSTGVTGGCHCDSCFRLRHIWLWNLAEALLAIHCAILMDRFVPMLTPNYYKAIERRRQMK